MTSSAQLEREAEETRSQFAQTLDELRERITPGQLVDQAFDYASDSGAGDFVRNLGRQMANNPLPVTLIGAGVAWLMLSNGGHSARPGRLTSRAAGEGVDSLRRKAGEAGARFGEAGRAAGERLSDWASDARAAVADAGRRASEMGDATRGTAQETAEEARSKAGEMAASASEGAASMYDSAKSSASDAYGRLADTATRATEKLSDTASSFGQSTAGTSKDFLRFCTAQPLVLAGLGIAVGATIGALIPSTETEDRLMGNTSDRMKNQAREIAGDQYEKAKSVVESGFETARAEAQSQGIAGADAGDATLAPAEDHATTHHSAE